MGKCLFFDADGTILDIVKTDIRLSSVPVVQTLLFLNIL